MSSDGDTPTPLWTIERGYQVFPSNCQVHRDRTRPSDAAGDRFIPAQLAIYVLFAELDGRERPYWKRIRPAYTLDLTVLNLTAS
jgi:hypothetical protein